MAGNNIQGMYPFSEIGEYIKHWKGDGRFNVDCRLAQETVKMSEARLLYENATTPERENCSNSIYCGLKCYPN